MKKLQINNDTAMAGVTISHSANYDCQLVTGVEINVADDGSYVSARAYTWSDTNIVILDWGTVEIKCSIDQMDRLLASLPDAIAKARNVDQDE